MKIYSATVSEGYTAGYSSTAKCFTRVELKPPYWKIIITFPFLDIRTGRWFTFWQDFASKVWFEICFCWQRRKCCALRMRETPDECFTRKEVVFCSVPSIYLLCFLPYLSLCKRKSFFGWIVRRGIGNNIFSMSVNKSFSGIPHFWAWINSHISELGLNAILHATAGERSNLTARVGRYCSRSIIVNFCAWIEKLCHYFFKNRSTS